MCAMLTSASHAGVAAADAVAPAVRASRGLRVSFRWKGVLALLVIVALALVLLGAAMAFRRAVEQDLDGLQRAQHQRVEQSRQWREAVRSGAGPTRLKALEGQAAEAEAETAHYLSEARLHTAAATVTLACIAWFGITLIGALSLLFFSRIATDIAAVRARALAIVFGERARGPTLVRHDELGELAEAVDSLADTLEQRDRELELERRHVMHHEKMAAIGAMAAGVIREIGNPIAAIDGYARALQEWRDQPHDAPQTPPPCEPADILHETGRLAAITHEIAELAALPATQRQWTDINEVVLRTLGLLRYEPRLEGIRIETRLDRQLPAVMGIADRLTQMLMNLMLNAADACAGRGARAAHIELETRRVPGGVELTVTDNGAGMSPEVLARAFEPLFTTKPAGLGTGLGLSQCRSIVQDDHGGTIELESAIGQGARARVRLPFEDDDVPR